jgi:hypothetical protein
MFGPLGGKPNWRITQSQLGWLTIERPAARLASSEPVVAHADWLGPVKLIGGHGGPVQRIDVFLGNHRHDLFDPLLNTGAEEDLEGVLAGVFGRAKALFSQKRAALADWLPPDGKRVVAWLSQAGHTVAMDKDENLRMTVRASGRDGQVRVVRQPGQFRFVMPLGSWTRLRSAAEAAMLRVAREANDHLRLGRIAWRAADDRCECEAQVDLTGLLVPGPSHPSGDSVICGMIQMAADALELALRQLQLELEVLADPQHEDLAEMVLFDCVR